MTAKCGHSHCRMIATWIIVRPGWGSPDHDYGLCDKHLAEMREMKVIGDNAPVRPA